MRGYPLIDILNAKKTLANSATAVHRIQKEAEADGDKTDFSRPILSLLVETSGA